MNNPAGSSGCADGPAHALTRRSMLRSIISFKQCQCNRGYNPSEPRRSPVASLRPSSLPRCWSATFCRAPCPNTASIISKFYDQLVSSQLEEVIRTPCRASQPHKRGRAQVRSLVVSAALRTSAETQAGSDLLNILRDDELLPRCQRLVVPLVVCARGSQWPSVPSLRCLSPFLILCAGVTQGH